MPVDSNTNVSSYEIPIQQKIFIVKPQRWSYYYMDFKTRYDDGTHQLEKRTIKSCAVF